MALWVALAVLAAAMIWVRMGRSGGDTGPSRALPGRKKCRWRLVDDRRALMEFHCDTQSPRPVEKRPRAMQEAAGAP